MARTQAVCLYAQEAIERVREDGHAAFPGAYGENLTLLGIDWASLRAGDRLAIGDGGEGEDGGGEDGRGDSGEDGVEPGALLELTRRAGPCQTIAHWFLERRIARISPTLNPDDARWYARVLREGPVAPGMAVRRITHRAHRATLPPSAPEERMTATQNAGDTAPAETREQLLAQHAAARARRNAARLGSHEWEQASADVGRIEVEIARIERAMDPPRV